MSACNERPPERHPLHGSLIACHLPAGHEGPHTWAGLPSAARQGVDALLRIMPNREIAKIDSQPEKPLMVYEVDEHGRRASKPYRRWDLPAGPWVLVSFVGGDEYAIWKQTGAVYRVGEDGAVDEDPILELSRPS